MQAQGNKAVYTIFFVVWQRITSGWLLHGFTRSQNRLNNGNNKKQIGLSLRYDDIYSFTCTFLRQERELGDQ